MTDKTPIELLEDPRAFIAKVAELSQQKEEEKPFDEFIIELMHWDGKGLFVILLKTFRVAVSEVDVAVARSYDVCATSKDQDKRNEVLKRIDGSQAVLIAMELFMVAFYEFDPDKLK